MMGEKVGLQLLKRGCVEPWFGGSVDVDVRAWVLLQASTRPGIPSP
jgi:hypothetical protein